MGLGNPGAEYKHTRHNVGFLALDKIAERLHADVKEKKFQSLIARAEHEGRSLLLMKPQTYMNNSGDAVGAALRFHHLSPADVLVICDDVNLPLGKLRIRPGGSYGGQNGLKSIIAALGTDEFPRLRIGVGRPEGGDGLRDYVLGKWERDEIPLIREQVDRAADAAFFVVGEGVQTAMNRFNGSG